MLIKDLLPDARTNYINQINGVYQFESGTVFNEILKTILANKGTFVTLRKNGLEIVDTIKWPSISASTTVSMGMLTKGLYLGMYSDIDYLVTFQLSEQFLREHEEYTRPVDLVEMLKEYGPYKWGSSVESAKGSLDTWTTLRKQRLRGELI